MENLNAEQVIRAFECCHSILLGCSDCPFINDSQACATSDKSALEVLKSQEQRIKELTVENERLRNRITCQVVIPNEKLEEIKTECLSRVELDVKAVQADTLEEYRKRVYRKMEKYTAFGREYIQRIMREVTKEMLEGGNNNE